MKFWSEDTAGSPFQERSQVAQFALNPSRADEDPLRDPDAIQTWSLTTTYNDQLQRAFGVLNQEGTFEKTLELVVENDLPPNDEDGTFLTQSIGDPTWRVGCGCPDDQPQSIPNETGNGLELAQT